MNKRRFHDFLKHPIFYISEPNLTCRGCFEKGFYMGNPLVKSFFNFDEAFRNDLSLKLWTFRKDGNWNAHSVVTASCSKYRYLSTGMKILPCWIFYDFKTSHFFMSYLITGVRIICYQMCNQKSIFVKKCRLCVSKRPLNSGTERCYDFSNIFLLKKLIWDFYTLKRFLKAIVWRGFKTRHQ